MARKAFLIFTPLFILSAGTILFLSARSFLKAREGCGCVNFETETGEFLLDRRAIFLGQKIQAPETALGEIDEKEKRVLGESTGQEKWIEIDLSDQKLFAWEGDQLFLESLISSGKWAPTPKGTYAIWSKFRHTKMEGGIRGTGTYYYLPNVPYVMFFYKGFGLHGTYWHNNFGQTMSHGCVNLPTPVSEKLYYWTGPMLAEGKNMARASADNPGTKVVIHD